MHTQPQEGSTPAGLAAGARPLAGPVVVKRRPGRAAGRYRVLAAIALGGGLGSGARYLISQWFPPPPGQFPWSTFWINVTGCFALGLLMVFVAEIRPPGRYARPFLGTGVLGGYTTFSTFAVEVTGLVRHGHWLLADAYGLDSLAGGVAAAVVGLALARLAGRVLR